MISAQDTKLDRANELRTKLREMDYFLDNISARLSDRSDKRYSFLNLISTTKTTKMIELKIFGKLYFGCGSHEKTIIVPPSFCYEIHKLATNHYRELKKELDSLI